ncbi:motility protein A [Glaciihabitans sp. dw_435]|uniref:motility protein A n=1 Tax=Glaciihabitans sp. dw_435 TaxID=2720081 RepID=UPI001BD4A9FF|nr:MotA/TolQ/ExbB proton channel family protein [Glaciihabitans sp. dw_435]
MDPATLIGLVVAFGALFGMFMIEGANITSILLPGPIVLVFGATIAVGIASGTLKDAILAVRALPNAFRGKVAKPDELIERLVAIADKARREGLLSLEEDATEATEPILKIALQNIADGTDGDELRALLEDEIHTSSKANFQAAKFFKLLGGYAPTVGIIGTVVSLTHVLENLDSPETLGPSIAAAFVATLWGLLSANFIWLPIGDKLTRLASLDADIMTLTLEGALAIQQGDQPRLVREHLRAMVPNAMLEPEPV